MHFYLFWILLGWEKVLRNFFWKKFIFLLERKFIKYIERIIKRVYEYEIMLEEDIINVKVYQWVQDKIRRPLHFQKSIVFLQVNSI